MANGLNFGKLGRDGAQIHANICPARLMKKGAATDGDAPRFTRGGNLPGAAANDHCTGLTAGAGLAVEGAAFG